MKEQEREDMKPVIAGEDGLDQPGVSDVAPEETPLERELWRQATAPVVEGEEREDWLGAQGRYIAFLRGEVELKPGDKELVRELADALEASRARTDWKPWQWRFLACLRQMGGILSLAYRKVGISSTTLAKYREKCPEFDRACRDILEQSIDRVEASLRVSATVGDIRPIYQGGVRVGNERRKDVRAAEILLRAKRSAEYRPDGATVNVAAIMTQTPDALASLVKTIPGVAPVSISEGKQEIDVSPSESTEAI